jgi:uncharacterized protein (DUF983 family)
LNNPDLPVNVRFACPICETPGSATIEGEAGEPVTWQCPRCEHRVELPRVVDPALPACVVCGNKELYKRKDFPHTLGLTILVLAFLASTVAYFFYNNHLTWAILLISAGFDGLLYLWVKDVIVCYRCHAHHRGITPTEQHAPFELTIHERYRQEQLRRKELERMS